MVHSQINKLNKIDLFCFDFNLSTSKFEFSAVRWRAGDLSAGLCGGNPDPSGLERCEDFVSTGRRGMN